MCPCQSGLRHKHCCGSRRDAMPPQPSAVEGLRLAGLALQRQGRLTEAIERYDAVLRERPGDWDVAHMRAVVLFQLGLLPEARDAFAALLSTPAAALPAFWTNLGLLVAAIAPDPLAARRRPVRPPRLPGPVVRFPPAVSVVMPAYNHAGFVEQAIDSVFSQSRLPLELIVIDDGSTDGTAATCRRALACAPVPVTFIARDNRGAPATLNEAIGRARGEFIQPLKSDDALPPQRIETMLAELLECDADWGFARVECISASGVRLEPGQHPRAASLTAAQDSVLMAAAPGLGLLRANAAVSTGNLTFRKTLWQAVGGFGDYRYNHDWDFCLRAALQSEPVVVGRQLYAFRIHATNTISENPTAPRIEHGRMMADFIATAQSRASWPNPLAPTLANWGQAYLGLLGATDSLRHLPVALVERLLTRAMAERPGDA